MTRAKTRQRLCLHEDTQDGVQVICTRDLNHDDDHKFIRQANMPTALRNALAAAREDDTTTEIPPVGPAPSDGALKVVDGTSIVKATSNGTGGTDRDFAELAHHVEILHTLRFEGETLIELLSVIKELKGQATGRNPVNPDLIGKGRMLFENWALQRGLGNGGGS